MTDGLDKRTSQSATCPYLAQEALYIYVVSDMSPFMSMTVSHGMHILLGLSHLMTIGFGTCAGKWWGLQKYSWSNQDNQC